MAVQIRVEERAVSEIGSRDFAQEHQDLMVASGMISQAESIKNTWMKAEDEIRSIIRSLKESDIQSIDLEIKINDLTHQAESLEELFLKIKEITSKEPTFCKIKRSVILGVGTSVGITSGAAGMGTIIYSYVNEAVPSLAPILLTAVGVATIGFQTLFWNKIKSQEEDRVSLVALGGRHGIITEARNISKLLRKIARTNSFAEASEYIQKLDLYASMDPLERATLNAKDLISSMKIAKIYPTVSNPVKTNEAKLSLKLDRRSSLEETAVDEVPELSDNSDGVEIFNNIEDDLAVCINENPRENFVIQIEEQSQNQIS